MAHRTPRTHPRIVGACLILTGASVAAAESSSTISELVALLDTTSLVLRESASTDLIERSNELALAMGNTVDPSGLSAEQRSRIGEILRQRFLLSPRAGLGVSFREVPGEGLTTGVNIAAVVPGFPAAELLQPGDLVIRAQGLPLVDQPRSKADASFRYAILSLNPGEQIHLSVLRDGNALDLEITMGSYSDLANGMQPDSRLLDGAWRVRSTRMELNAGRIERLQLGKIERWVASYKPRRDVPGMLPGGRPKGLREAEESVPALAKVDANARAHTKQRLVAAAVLREIETRINVNRTRLRNARDEASRINPAENAFQELQREIRQLEQELEVFARQRKETLARVKPRNGANR